MSYHGNSINNTKATDNIFFETLRYIYVSTVKISFQLNFWLGEGGGGGTGVFSESKTPWAGKG